MSSEKPSASRRRPGYRGTSEPSGSPSSYVSPPAAAGSASTRSPRPVNLAWSGPAPPAHPRFPAERGLTGAAISARETVVSNDVARDPRYLTALASTGSELIVPVVVGDRVLGTLDVEDGRTDAFGDDDRRLFESVAGEMGPLYE
jgi:GAF domain-containing protein